MVKKRRHRAGAVHEPGWRWGKTDEGELVSRRLAALASVALAGGALVAACGSSSDKSSGGGSSGSTSTGATKGAKVIDVKSTTSAKGNVTFCLGKDTAGDKTA